MIGIGLLAGAAGTMALDVYTYADMLAQARPSSTVPSTVVQRLAGGIGLTPLATGDEKATNRRSGAGALMGYGVGLGSGVGYALLRPYVRDWLPWPIAGLILGATTLVVSEGSATALGATDWSEWSAAEWAANIIPRSLFGLATAYVVERLMDEEDLAG